MLHTTAYWLMLAVREAIQKIRDLARAEFTPPRLGLLKIAAQDRGDAICVRIASAAACPEADLITVLSAALLRHRI